MNPMIRILAIVIAAAIARPALAQEPTTIKLWPGKVPGETGNVGPEKFVEPKVPEKSPIKRVTNVTEPTITIYRPRSRSGFGPGLDMNNLFDKYAKERGYFLTSEMKRLGPYLEKYAKDKGIADEKITREHLLQFW